jgi:diacylglycerol kinase (ATP)
MVEEAETVGAVVNPASGDGRGEQLYGDLIDRMSDAEVRGRVTTGPDDVVAATREQADRDLLACVGGDGTLREVASALLDCADPPPLLVVPAGRGNSVYRHLYGETDWRVLAAALDRGYEPAPLDVGAVHAAPPLGEPRFLLGFTAGLFRGIVDHAGRFDALPGRLGYAVGTARAVLGGDPVMSSLVVDGEPVFAGEARLLAVGGGRYRGGGFELFPGSRPGDGRVHAIAIEQVGLREAVSLVRRARAGHLDEHERVYRGTGETARLTVETGAPVEIDGTPVGTDITEARIEILAGALCHARPAGTAQEPAEVDRA